MMVYKLGVIGLWTISILQISKYVKNTDFRKLGLFPSSGD
jgi:hypothetical protein